MINRKERLLRAVENGFHVTTEGQTFNLDDCKAGTVTDYTIYGNTEQSKNLLKFPYYDGSKTSNGITFTDNGDGTVTANGTATATANFYIQGTSTNIPLGTGTYWLSGCPEGGSELTYYLNAANKNDTGSGIAITPNGTLPYACTIIIKTGTTVENLVFKPQLEKGTSATEYEVFSRKDLGVKGKNLLEYPYRQTTKTVNGVTFADNGDYSVTVSGTSTGYADFYFSTYLEVKPSTVYTFSIKTLEPLANVSFGINELDITKRTMISYTKASNQIPFTFTTKSSTHFLTIYVKRTNNNEVCSGTFKPQLELGSTATDYEPICYKIPILSMGENLIDADSVLTAQGWEKQDDDSYYVASNTTVYQKKLWENTEGYTGQINVEYSFKFLKDYTEAYCGSHLRITYTDGTYTSVSLSNNQFPSDKWMRPDKTNSISEEGKIVDYISWYYGTGSNSTWVRDVVISKVINNFPQTIDLYLSAPLKDGESINFINDNLPKLTLFNGKNTIVTETDILPKNMSIKYISKVKK